MYYIYSVYMYMYGIPLLSLQRSTAEVEWSAGEKSHHRVGLQGKVCVLHEWAISPLNSFSSVLGGL